MEKKDRKEYMKEYNQKPELKLKKRKWRVENKEKATESFEGFKKENPERYAKQKRKGQLIYANKHPKIIKAHTQARKIEISTPCEKCESIKNLHKHHPDYNKPTDVQILCKDCHRDIHMEIRNG